MFPALFQCGKVLSFFIFDLFRKQKKKKYIVALNIWKFIKHLTVYESRTVDGKIQCGITKAALTCTDMENLIEVPPTSHMKSCLDI